MNKKYLLIIILVISIVFISLIILSLKPKYDKYIINKSDWEQIIINKENNSDIYLETISFNDNKLIIDKTNSTIYYSIVESRKKYNPSINFTTNDKSLKLVINKKLTDNNNSVEIMIYNDKNYHKYELITTDFPLLNLYNITKNAYKTTVDVDAFDNHINSPRRLTKSQGELNTIEENKTYGLKLKTESVGHNSRKNPIALFGLDKDNRFILDATYDTEKQERYIQLFFDNEYQGVYIIKPEGRNERFDPKQR